MENVEEIISRLKFIGYIQKNEKINVRHVNRQPSTFLTTIYRTIIYPDNRYNSLKFVKDVINNSFIILEKYIKENNEIISRSLGSDLIKAKEGILNLKYTYKEDTKFCCDMDVIIEAVSAKIITLQKNHSNVFRDLNIN